TGIELRAEADRDRDASLVIDRHVVLTGEHLCSWTSPSRRAVSGGPRRLRHPHRPPTGRSCWRCASPLVPTGHHFAPLAAIVAAILGSSRPDLASPRCALPLVRSRTGYEEPDACPWYRSPIECGTAPHYAA